MKVKPNSPLSPLALDLLRKLYDGPKHINTYRVPTVKSLLRKGLVMWGGGEYLNMLQISDAGLALLAEAMKERAKP